MADKDDRQKTSILNNVNKIVSDLFNVSKATTYNTYKVEKDLYDTDRLLDKLGKVQDKNKAAIKSTIDGSNFANGRINSFGLLGERDSRSLNSKDSRTINNMGGGKQPEQPDNVFDLIKTQTTAFSELRQHLLINNKFYEIIADYEILRRSIPEVSRVIDLLINSVIIPEIITSKTFNVDYKFEDEEKNEQAKKVRDKYELDSKVRVIVENYFVTGVEYVTVVPYRAVVEAIKVHSNKNLDKAKMIKESALFPEGSLTNKYMTETSEYLQEHTFSDKLTGELKKEFEKQKITPAKLKLETETFNNELNSYLGALKVYKSNKSLIYNEAMVEGVTQDKDSYMFESSFDEMMDAKVKLPKNFNNGEVEATDGLVQTKKGGDYDKIKVNGCKIERLDPARVYPLRIKDTIIAYVYLEERRDESLQFNIQSTMRNSFSFYRMHSQSYTEYTMKGMEDRILKEMGQRILTNLSPKFLEANFDEMDIFYEFLRDHNLHKERRDIILLHPDDVIEFKRANGSIMKNAVFFAKLYLLMVINNILIKVRRGSDRTIYYVDSGLSNDIEGSVMEAIEAIQQSEIRFSDLGSITGIIGSVGSVVDLFIPQSQDGGKPVNPDVIAGQTVDMDEDFLKYLIKSIILSFNIPSVVVDFTNEVEFAKTLSMANLDVATSSALAQSELNVPLTQLLKKVMAYDLDLTQDDIDTIEAHLIPSRSMLMQISSDLINTTKDLGRTMADINIVDEDSEMIKKLFVRDYVRENFNYEWSDVDSIIKNIKEQLTEENLKEEIRTPDVDPSEMDDEEQ